MGARGIMPELESARYRPAIESIPNDRDKRLAAAMLIASFEIPNDAGKELGGLLLALDRFIELAGGTPPSHEP